MFEDMKNKVRQRDEKANELYPRVEGMLADLENMCETHGSTVAFNFT